MEPCKLVWVPNSDTYISVSERIFSLHRDFDWPAKIEIPCSELFIFALYREPSFPHSDGLQHPTIPLKGRNVLSAAHQLYQVPIEWP